MAEAIRQAFGNMFAYRGRVSRSAYRPMVLFSAAATVIGYAVAALPALAAAHAGAVLSVVAILVWIGYIALFPAGLPLLTRRLHDSGTSGFWPFIDPVPFGGIVIPMFTLLPGGPHPNVPGWPFLRVWLTCAAGPWAGAHVRGMSNQTLSPPASRAASTRTRGVTW